MKLKVIVAESANQSFEEENGVRYIGGYVVKNLMEHPDCSDMVCTDDIPDENSPSAAWTIIKCINRGAW